MKASNLALAQTVSTQEEELDVLHEESDELHRTVDVFELEVGELRVRAVVPKSEHEILEARCAELQETVWELEELRRSQAWRSSRAGSPGREGSPAGSRSVLSVSGGVGDVSASEAMMAQEVIADLRRQVAEFESHVRARDQAVAAAVAAFDMAKLARDAAEERVRVLEARPGAAGSAAVEEIVTTLEAEMRALQGELRTLREKETAGEYETYKIAGSP